MGNGAGGLRPPHPPVVPGPRLRRRIWPMGSGHNFSLSATVGPPCLVVRPLWPVVKLVKPKNEFSKINFQGENRKKSILKINFLTSAQKNTLKFAPVQQKVFWP